jgi:general stress protein 26
MLKAKAIIKIEVDQDKIPTSWKEDLKMFFSSLDGAMVHFGGESKGVMKIKNIKIEESKKENK